MVIQVDTREKPSATGKILNEFNKRGIEVVRSKLFVGDYMSFDNPRLVVDRKQNLVEVATNIASKDKLRFQAELKRAKQLGIHIVFLVEHSKNVTCLKDVQYWENPRCKESPLAPNGERLYKMMLAYQNNKDDYDLEWQFCDKDATGRRIIKILGGIE